MQTIFFYKKISGDYLENISTAFSKDYVSFEVDKNLFNLGFSFRSEPFDVLDSSRKYLFYNLDTKCFTQTYETNNEKNSLGYFYGCYV